MLRFSTLTIFALAAAFVAAQSAPSECIVTCSTAAATAAGCSSYTDFTCVCNSRAFQTNAGQCIATTCPDQLAAATALQEAACAGVSGAPSATTPNALPGGNAPSSSAPSPSAPSSSAPSSTPGAAFINAPVAGAMGVLAALIGAAIF